VTERIKPGHWEGDLIIGARNRSAPITLAERDSKYTMIVDLPNGYSYGVGVEGSSDPHRTVSG
jgi:IS30 family transposase